MKHPTWNRIGLGLLVILVIIVAPWSGISHNRYSPPIQWTGGLQFSYVIHNPGFQTVPGGTNIQNAQIEQGAASWNSLSQLKFVRLATTTNKNETVSKDMQNKVIVRTLQTSPANLPIIQSSDNEATAYIWYRLTDLAIEECDIVFWDRGQFSLSGSIPSDKYDIQGIAAQEFGHCVGLDHDPLNSDTLNCQLQSCNTMRPQIDKGAPSQDMRQQKCHDRHIAEIYPPGPGC